MVRSFDRAAGVAGGGIAASSASASAPGFSSESRPLISSQLSWWLRWLGLGFSRTRVNLPSQALAKQDKFDFSVAKAFVGLDQRFPGAAVPGLHGAGAIMSVGDGALEVGIVQRVVLDMNGDALVGGVQGGPFANGPAPEHVVVLQPEVPVQTGAAGLMLLHHEYRGLLACPRPTDREPVRLSR